MRTWMLYTPHQASDAKNVLAQWYKFSAVFTDKLLRTGVKEEVLKYVGLLLEWVEKREKFEIHGMKKLEAVYLQRLKSNRQQAVGIQHVISNT